MQKTILSTSIILLLGSVSVFYAYSSNLYGPFIYDDIWQIVDSEDIENAQYLTANNWRIIPNFTFWLNYNLGPQLEGRNTITTIGGPSLFYWHITNIVLHFACAIALLLLCKDLKFPRALSILVSGVFLVHPLASEAVNYIQARSMILLTLFLLLSIIYRERNILFVLFSLGTILCKEVACFYLLATYIIFSYKKKSQLHKKIPLLGLVCFVIIAFLSPVIYNRFAAGDFFSNLTKQLVAFWYYVKLFIYPAATQLSLDHVTQNFSHGFSSLFALILTGFILCKLNNKVAPRAFLACMVILIPYAFIPTNFVVVEYRAYPFLVFLVVGVASVGLSLYENLVQQARKFYQNQAQKGQNRQSKQKFLYFLAHTTLLCLFVLLLLILSQETRKRSRVWQSAISIYGDTIDKGTLRPSIRFNFCMAYVSTAQWMWENNRQQLARIYFTYGKQHINSYLKEAKKISAQHLLHLRLQLLKVYEIEENFSKILALTTLLKQQVPKHSSHYSLLLLLEAQTYLKQQKSKECETVLLQLKSLKLSKNIQRRYTELLQKLQQLHKQK
ncbi:hypothetical protein [Candidatus Uabimicrobium amorphum]|uniref:Glycosyltransferase RgtA/B/C/D-like domain-containing protein n=1 Tax=Uabimicrobium amorphum TaxID=2596890 RepID=A0A5S9IKI5_UABAM|nr:hypothetical protein [Candidatus Uabimicrobium amorphum]BBM83217.1 hypothetical protein UABAM_01568 [Candidatus Uabimicrobium amorphum]